MFIIIYTFVILLYNLHVDALNFFACIFAFCSLPLPFLLLYTFYSAVACIFWATKHLTVGKHCSMLSVKPRKVRILVHEVVDVSTYLFLKEKGIGMKK